MILNLSAYQIIPIAMSLYFILIGISRFINKEKGQTFFKLFLTISTWSGVLIFSSFPGLTHVLSSRLGFGENLNTLIFIGFVVVFMIIFRLIGIIEKIERDITEIVRREALSKLDDNKE